MPPPEINPGPLFQTTSDVIVVPLAVSEVPPQASAPGLAEGKSTCCLPPRPLSLDPVSPDAVQTVIPSKAAAARMLSICCRAFADQKSSDAPQLMEITEGFRMVSCTAVFTQLMKD